MTIEVRKPTKEFYKALDEVITHQIKSREAFDKAIEIGRKQGYDDFTISLFIKDYLKEKIPKTSLYRYLKEINPNAVPMEQIYYNNVLEQKGTQEQKEEPWNYEYEDMILDRVEGFDGMEKYILDIARLFRKLGYSEHKVFSETKRMCKAGGYGPGELDHVDVVLHWKYDLYRKLDNFPGERQPARFLVGYIKIAATLDMYGIPRDKISAKIKEIALPICGKEESHRIDWALQPIGTYADPNIPKRDYLGEYINSILPQKYGGYLDDEVHEALEDEAMIGIGDGRRYDADEKYCRHCIAKNKK